MDKSQKESFLCLAGWVHPKRVEYPSLYDARQDELYELNDDGYEFLRSCDGTRTIEELSPEEEFLDTCLEAGLLTLLPEPSPRTIPPASQSPIPSLRYLEVQLTSRCNLTCAHCYLGPAKAEDLSPIEARAIFDEFERMQGMRVLLTGGEPLLSPNFWEIHDDAVARSLRILLLTNGHLITPEVAARLKVDEVQVSIDGLQSGHDMVRGEGSFEKAMKGLQAVVDAGIEVSVATVVHEGNLDQFDELGKVVEGLGVSRWGIDAVCKAGNAEGNSIFDVPPATAAKLMEHSFGGSFHGEASVEGCGLHLAAITPNGEILRCGFYPEAPLGELLGGIERAWLTKPPWPLEKSNCASCAAIEECGGGCRFRGETAASPDPVMCHLHLGEFVTG